VAEIPANTRAGAIDRLGRIEAKLRLENTVSMSVSSDRGSGFVHITFRSHAPEVGIANLARAIVICQVYSTW